MTELEELRERVRIAEAVRDDARKASQLYLEEKRALQAELNQIKERMRYVYPS